MSQRQRLVLRLLRRPHERQLRRALGKTHPADLAQIFVLLTPDEQQRLVEILLDLRLAARTLRELDPETQRGVLATLSDDHLGGIVARLSLDDAADVLAQLDEARRAAVLQKLEHPLAARLANLLRYGEATAGGLMNPDVVAFPASSTVGETLAQLRSLAGGRRLFYLYVVNEGGQLVGIVNLWQLVTAASEQTLREVMSGDVVRVEVERPQEEVARVFSRYDLLMLPVVDEEGRLVGAITVDDVLDVVEEEATEDLYRLANLDVHEGIATHPLRSVRLRLPWLLVNLGTAFLAAWVVSRFQATIAKYVVLAVFMPIVAGMGGNAATQTLTVIVRGIALGELTWANTRKALIKEGLVGIGNGVATGLVAAIGAFLLSGDPMLGVVLAMAMVINMFVAATAGTLIPLTLRAAQIDPALASSVFITTLTDVFGFLSFLGLGTVFLRYLHVA